MEVILVTFTCQDVCSNIMNKYWNIAIYLIRLSMEMEMFQ